MKCKIQAFGISQEIVGSKFLEIEIPENHTVADLKKDLFQTYPRFEALNSLFIAVNREYANEGSFLKEGDEIALIPPVSGG